MTITLADIVTLISGVGGTGGMYILGRFFERKKNSVEVDKLRLELQESKLKIDKEASEFWKSMLNDYRSETGKELERLRTAQQELRTELDRAGGREEEYIRQIDQLKDVVANLERQIQKMHTEIEAEQVRILSPKSKKTT